MKPCDICLDKKCGGTETCNCETCASKDCCPKLMGPRPTIRITTKCTQSCGHCCWGSGPEKQDMMTVETSEKIGRFLKANEIKSVNLMGGEFFCNSDWFEIFSNIMNGLSNHARIVTNSDWAANEQLSAKVIEFAKRYNVYFALSFDKWHTNKYVEEAKALLNTNNISYHLGERECDKEDTFDSPLVPVGRSSFSLGFYGTFGVYCHEEITKYAFLIDESGIIYKCPFGIWDYDEIDNFLEGGFISRFKEVNEKFYKHFISNCKRCIEAYQYHKKHKEG